MLVMQRPKVEALDDADGDRQLFAVGPLEPGFGHTLGKTIAFGYVPVEAAAQSQFTIEAFGRAYPAVRGPRCLYDARMERLRG